METNAPIRRKNLYSWAFAAWIVLSAVWIWLAAATCLPTYNVNYNEPVNYAELLNRHSIYRLDNPLIALVATVVVGIVLLFRAKRWWLGGLFLPLIPFACYMLFGSLFCDQTTLQHIDTVEFDGHIYHLTRGYEVAGGADVFFHILYLHECDQKGKNCRGRGITRSGLEEFKNPRLMVDETTNQLSVFSADQLLFTLDANIVPLTIPQDREPIQFENLASVQEFARLHYGLTYDLAWSHDSAFLAAVGHLTVWLHRFQSETISTETIPMRGNTNIAFSPDHHLLAITNSLDGPVQMWNVDSLTEQITLPFSYTGDVAFSPVGRFFATGRDRQVILLDASNFTELAVLIDESWHSILDLVFSPDGLLLAASGFDHSDEDGRNFVRIWNTQSEEAIFYFRGPHDVSSLELAFAPDSSRLAFGTKENLNPDYYPIENEARIHVWDVQENTELFSVVLPSEIYEISDLVWTPDGKVIITASHSDMLQFWDAATGDLLGTVEIESANMSVLALSPDGTLLATGGSDGTIRLWAVLSTTE